MIDEIICIILREYFDLGTNYMTSLIYVLNEVHLTKNISLLRLSSRFRLEFVNDNS